MKKIIIAIVMFFTIGFVCQEAFAYNNTGWHVVKSRSYRRGR